MSLADDIRRIDPQKGGERLLRYRQLHPDLPLHEVADMFPWDDPELVVSEDLGNRHVEDRYRELTERAAQGDRFAAAILRGDSLAEEVVD